MQGRQEASVYNGYFESFCYDPQFLFNDEGDCLAAKLRPGNVQSADDWEELLVPDFRLRTCVAGVRSTRFGGQIRNVDQSRSTAQEDIYESQDDRSAT